MRRTTILAVACGLLFVSGAAGAADLVSPAPAPRPLALVYRGPAACDGCSQAVATLLRRAPQRFRVAWVGPGTGRPLSAAGLRGAALYAQPGGNDSVGWTMRRLGPVAVRAIRGYVSGGGRYLGICMGAYLAGSSPGMGLLSPGDTGEYDRTRGASVHGAAQAVVRVRFHGSWVPQYAQDPPYIVASRVAGERVLARFSNGRIDALARPVGRGAVGVIGTHPEADRSWFTRRMWREMGERDEPGPGLALISSVMSLG